MRKCFLVDTRSCSNSSSADFSTHNVQITYFCFIKCKNIILKEQTLYIIKVGRHSGGNLSVRLGSILLLFISLSFALIDPPVMDVNTHDLAIAPHSLLHYNALNLSGKVPSLGDPTIFFYVKILTLTPSVNFSVNSAMQPSLVWLAAESHNRTVEENWSDGSCTSYRRRTFSDAKLEDVTAYYTLSGVLHDDGGNYTFLTINDTQLLADNASFNDPIITPFQRSTGCSLLESFFGFFLGHQMDLSCNEDSLYRASPYPNGTMNFTDRDIGVVNPQLNATIYANLSIPYQEEWNYCAEGKSGCDCSGGSGDGVIELSNQDTQSYDVQNDRMTMLVYSPQFMGLDSNTSDDVVYHVSLLSTSDLYKYYSVMDNQAAGAYYLDSFDVVNDSYGTEFIVASQINHTGLLPDDPAQNYSGSERLDHVISGMYLRSPTEFDNASYNYSRVYDIEDTFTGLSPGTHQAELEFFTYFGNYTAQSNISVRLLTNLSVVAGPYSSGQTLVVCALFGNDTPLSGAPVELRIGNETHISVTDAHGGCSAVFSTSHSIDTVYASYAGSDVYLPSEADMPFSNGLSFDAGAINNLGLLLIPAGMLSFMFLGMARSVGSKNPGVGQFLAPVRTPNKKTTKPKKKSGVVAIGGAAGSNNGEDAKKDSKKEAAKEREEKAKREMAEKVEGKALKVKRFGDGGAGTPEDDRKKKMTEIVRKHLGPHLVEVYQKAKMSCENLGHPEWMNKFLEKDMTFKDPTGVEKTYHLKIGRVDWQMVEKLDSQNDYAVTEISRHGSEARYLVSIREDRAGGLSTLLPDAYHEDFHTRNKLDEGKHGNKVEGANEVMSYEDSIRKLNMMESRELDALSDIVESSEIKSEKLNRLHEKYEQLRNDVYIAPGSYREYATSQYLLKQIIGEDNFNAGHLVVGEGYLEDAFDNIAGKGEYKRIFGVQKDKSTGEWVEVMSDKDKTKILESVYNNLDCPIEQKIKVAKSVGRINSEGKYDL